ncbi:hypothetical protein CNMCM6805_006156 [Aspergillus fumigatiaffinis]|uniref:tRNA(Ile)-lysidine synthetase n=1 Tax=Aspergillus fumigatiaffinis TaxID=340414 RepID=A0A8H4H8I8_9EURO|nr:hypothetical protein CNMCM6805_006156 [Aspergillus fumigatiaffinis]
MAASCLSRQLSHKAITASQLLEHFQRAWCESRLSWGGRQANRHIPRNLGLAVSGGADSMALAFLCKQLQDQNLVDGMTVTAFVVDHKAREESSREARTVATWLSDMGLQAQILELEWPQGSSVSAFETHARRLRFQALGIACRDRRISALLMGHHQDDNVETTLWRLCTGARGAGLAGIPPIARIPECHGLYGVSESGSSAVLRPRDDRAGAPSAVVGNTTAPHVQDKVEGKDKQRGFPMATGGILLCRPLLAFPKASLLATCHQHRIPYVSDPTNFDPTLTPRNAIRSLLSPSSRPLLPRALQAPSILSLIKSSHALIEDAIAHSNNLLSQCRLLDFNPSTGTMLIRFPSPQLQPQPQPQLIRSPHFHTQVQSLTLRRITELISPHPDNHFPLPSFEKFTAEVFPSSSSSPTPANRLPFTLGGIMFHPLQPTSTSTPNHTENENTWLLTRQPYMRNRAPSLTLDLPGPKSKDSYSPWKLWDNRYWVRAAVVPDKGERDPDVHAQYTQSELDEIRRCYDAEGLSLVLRPLRQSDLQAIRGMADGQGRGKKHQHPALTALLKRLALEAPGQARFTVPVLVVRKNSGGNSDQVPLALPTLSCRLLSASQAQSLLQSSMLGNVRWQWMYKMIDQDPLKLMGWL